MAAYAPLPPSSPSPSLPPRPSCFVRVRLAGFEGRWEPVIDDATEREIRGTFLAQRRGISRKLKRPGTECRRGRGGEGRGRRFALLGNSLDWIYDGHLTSRRCIGVRSRYIGGADCVCVCVCVCVWVYLFTVFLRPARLSLIDSDCRC
jgi:hypothetical protein